ncbi:MAG: 5-oxoprolinase subunit PxpB [Longimicrobiales bacterium]
MELLPLGDSAVLIRVADTLSAATHAHVRAICAELDRAPVVGMVELVPAYTAVAVHYDLNVFSAAQTGPFAALSALLEERLANLQVAAPPPGPLVEVPVRYGGVDGPDLEEVAQHAGLSAEEVVRVHASAEYQVYMIGFSPGFPYMAGLPEEIAMPRRNSPRLAVPAGSVGIGGRQTGIYPMETPGGWRIIGRTDLRLFRPESDPPTLFQLGDRVRFVPLDPA